MPDDTKYAISQFRAAIDGLRKPTPRSDQLPLAPGQESNKSQWLRWLEEYLEPGFYNRQTFVDDAKTAYQRLNNGRMIVWLNEAAGENPRIIEAAIIAMDERDAPQTEAKFARRVLPWDRLARLLFDGVGT
jgi:hypothetical protein